jgi:hypothetical protein
METIGVASSIVAIVQITRAIILGCQSCIKAVTGASSELRLMLIKVLILEALANNMQFLTQPHDADSVLSNHLPSITQAIEGSRKALEELKTLFPAAPTNSQRSKS